MAPKKPVLKATIKKTGKPTKPGCVEPCAKKKKKKAKAPTAAELQKNKTVKKEIDKAWKDSKPGDPKLRHEEGGWIYRDSKTGAITTKRQAAGAQAGIVLSSPPTVKGSVVVGKFHTHPNPTSEGWKPGPSGSVGAAGGDITVDAKHGVPDLIRADNGDYVSGPDSRRGGLGGGHGFPP